MLKLPEVHPADTTTLTHTRAHADEILQRQFEEYFENEKNICES